MTDQPAQSFGEDTAAEESGERATRRWPTRRLAIIGAAGLAVLGGAGFGAASWLGRTGRDPAREPPPAFFELPEMTVNLSTVDNNPKYLRLRAALELTDERIANDIEPVLPRVLDAFQVYLRELRTTDLEGSAGLYRLKEELVRRVNMAIHPAEIEGVVFKELIVQ